MILVITASLLTGGVLAAVCTFLFHQVASKASFHRPSSAPRTQIVADASSAGDRIAKWDALDDRQLSRLLKTSARKP